MNTDVNYFYNLFIRKEKKTIKLDSTRSFAAPFVGFAFKIEVNSINRFLLIIDLNLGWWSKYKYNTINICTCLSRWC